MAQTKSIFEYGLNDFGVLNVIKYISNELEAIPNRVERINEVRKIR